MSCPQAKVLSPHNKVRLRRVESLADIFQDKKGDGCLTPYISSLASKARNNVNNVEDILDALDLIGEDVNAW
eukprot:CAMPEP_0171498668 /NCGR_PEP_ID=MMETSP0958-20121227/7982_1 /TAXON_ID=87120 /ORGANISM="Aurantiochytrium limacinum, Strain ATCCMYA-1381" /LENGTH=71 /DNA_ID=CAMNT_0012033101 /DNA_START=474 /DNA_END=686 /DNA_ORIENTATION=-